MVVQKYLVLQLCFKFVSRFDILVREFYSIILWLSFWSSHHPKKAPYKILPFGFVVSDEKSGRRRTSHDRDIHIL